MYQLPSPYYRQGATSQMKKRLLLHSYYLERRKTAIRTSRGTRIGHLNETTTFYHPLTGKSDMDEEFPEQEDVNNTTSDSTSKNQKPSRSHSFVKKKVSKEVTPLVKRNPNSPVVKEGWLQKRDSGPLSVWRRRWCILSDFCLFYYKDQTDSEHVGSIMLPSYNVCPVGPKEKGTKKFAFKCEHENMRTYYFAGASQEDMDSWMRALHAASKLELDPNNGKQERDDEDWGRGTTLPRSVSQPPNGIHDNSRVSVGQSEDLNTRLHSPQESNRPHSWQNGYRGDSDPPIREDERYRVKRDYEEVPRRSRPESSSPLYASPYRDDRHNRPQSVGPGDYPEDDSRQPRQNFPREDPRNQRMNRSKSLPRHVGPPPGSRGRSHDPYSTMPRNQNTRPASSVPPTYVDPLEIQMRKRQNKNLEAPPPQHGGSREPSVQSYPSVFGSNDSDPPQRPPYPAGYEGRRPDQNANYAKPPNQVFQQRRAPTPEQRSVLQSPMQHSPPSREPEQRNDLNSPVSYQRPPPMERPVSRQQSHREERIPQPLVNVEVQRSAVPDLRSSPSQRSQRSVNSYGPHSPNSRDGRDSVDIAPSRQRPPVSRNSTLREERGGDQLAPLSSFQGNRLNNRPQNNPQRLQPGQPTSRFRMWQQKAQPYIMLSTGIRLRLSIAANDLLGKSHEELVLFLIQLRRDKANMEEWLRMIDNELNVIRTNPGYANENQSALRSRQSDSLRRSNPNLSEDDLYEAELKKEKDEVSRELEVSLPLINLVDNLVRMGSLYGGQNELIAHEFYKNQYQKDLPQVTPKMMVEYTRQQEEEKLMNGIEEDHRKLQTAEDRELDEKLRKLRSLDQKLQEISSNVYVLKEEKDQIENSMEQVRQEFEREWENKEAQMELEDQQIRLDRQLIRVRSHLAQGTKDLEDITTENAKLEHEIALLRMKRQKDEPMENGYYPGDRELMEIRNEVSNVQTKMTTLDRKRAELMQQMAGFRKETDNEFFSSDVSPVTLHELPPQQTFDFQSTDLDTNESWDISSNRYAPPPGVGKSPQSRLDRPQELPIHQQRYSLPPQGSSEAHHQRPHSQGEPVVPRSHQQDQLAAHSRHSLPPGVIGVSSQYGTPERRPQEVHQRTPTDPRRTPSDPSRTPDQNWSRSSDQYGRPPSQGQRTPNHYERQQPGSGPRLKSSPSEPTVHPVQSQVAYSQPASLRGGPYQDRRDQRQPHGEEMYSQGEMRSPQGARRSSSSSSYKVTDLDTRESWDISQIDIRSPVDDRPLLSPGEVLPRKDLSLVYQGGPPSVQETPSDSEVAELTRRSETFPRSGSSLQQPPPPMRGSDSYRRVKTDDSTRPVSEDDKKRRKEPPSYKQVSIGFKPKSSQPRSRDSDTESTSSSIRNSSVYGPTPYRRSIDASVRRISKTEGHNRNADSKAPSYSRAPPYQLSNSNRVQATIEREVASDTEAVPPPPPATSQQVRGGLKTQDVIQKASDDLHIGTLERALQAAEEDSTSRNGSVVKSSLKNVEVDESTGGGLMRTHSLPLSYLRAKRRVVKFNFFATVHPYPSSRNKLGVPGKIVIPERYNPAKDEDIEDRTKLTEEERAVRDERAENIAKMLSEHSMQSWHPSEINHNWLHEGHQTSEDLHSRVKEEKLLRQGMLAKTRALAEEVKEHSLRRGREVNPDETKQNTYVDQSYHLSSEEER